MSDEMLGFLKDRDIKFTLNAKLDRLSYIKAGGTARMLAEPESLSQLCELSSRLAKEKIPYRIIGRMSNTMSGDGEYDGVVIKTDKLNRKYGAESTIVAECGAKLSDVIWDMARRDMGGCEELFLIPASVGGAVYNNAGAHGRCISDVIASCEVYYPKDRRTVTLSREEMCFGYRDSLLKSRDAILLRATLKFEKKPFSDIKERIRECAKIRRAAQPLEYPSLGSVFKRHGDVGAGYYIDRAGLKGLRVGNAEVSRKHAGFIINLGGAVPSDITTLIIEVKRRVFDTFGIMLEEEIEII